MSIFDRKGSLRLLVGQAHGIRVGDCFALSPIGSAGGSTTKKNLVAKVARLWSLSSELEVASPLSRSLGDWVAEPITCLYLMKFPIRLASELSHRHEWQEMLEKLSLTICIGKDQVPAFQVVLRNDMYQILDDHGQDVINLPMMPQGATDIGRVCEILEHLTRYRMVKDMTNEVPPAALENSIDIQIKANGNVFHSDEQIEVRHDSVIQLVIKNMGQHTAYIHVYNLGPLWQVKGILYASYEVIPERSRDSGFTGITSKKIRMTVPPAMNECGSCNDVVKVFVTSQPTSFDWFELPSLDELGKTTIQNRTNRPDYDEAEAWVALNFPIRTTLEKCSYPSGSSMR
ncbi:hypothetical protein N0V94_007673 [Neodidymelliopsis sp. IMI 364377]|nr:hypothetical protein N0V94_007673 [Neodidymelliopsis sp. IMI 364377]